MTYTYDLCIGTLAMADPMVKSSRSLSLLPVVAPNIILRFYRYIYIYIYIYILQKKEKEKGTWSWGVVGLKISKAIDITYRVLFTLHSTCDKLTISFQTWQQGNIYNIGV
jgi:hypothetical protein